MLRQARIVDIDDHSVLLKLLENPRCADCTALCGQRLLSLFGQNTENIVVQRGNSRSSSHIDDQGFFTDQHEIGQTVVMQIHHQQLLNSSIHLYLMPLLVLLLSLLFGYTAFNWLGWNADGGGIIGFIVGVLFLVYFKGGRNASRPEVTFLQQ